MPAKCALQSSVVGTVVAPAPHAAQPPGSRTPLPPAPRPGEKAP